MNELSKLKKMWDSSFAGQSDNIDHDKLMAAIRGKSSGPIEKLKRSLYIEIGAIIAVLPFLFLVLYLLPETYFIINTLALILLFITALAYYFINLQKVSRLWKKNQQNLRQSLESMLVVFRFFRKTYFYLNILFFPLGIYFGYIIGFGIGSGGDRIRSLLLFEEMSLTINVMIYLAVATAAFLLFYAFLRFYMKKLYDVHIIKLENILKELTENNHHQ